MPGLTEEVLAALAASFKLTYKLPPNVSRDFNGFYSGSLRSVLIRILDGTDYFIKNGADAIEVVVLRVSGTQAGPAPPPLASYLTNN